MVQRDIHLLVIRSYEVEMDYISADMYRSINFDLHAPTKDDITETNDSPRTPSLFLVS